MKHSMHSLVVSSGTLPQPQGGFKKKNNQQQQVTKNVNFQNTTSNTACAYLSIYQSVSLSVCL